MPSKKSGLYKSLLLLIGIALIVIYFVEKSRNKEHIKSDNPDKDKLATYDDAMTGIITLGGLLLGFSGGTFLHCQPGEESDIYLIVIMIVLIAVVSCASVALAQIDTSDKSGSDEDEKSGTRSILGTTIALTVVLGILPVGYIIFKHPKTKSITGVGGNSPDFGFSFEF